MKILKKNNGITLIALVITIVVLIILASVAITLSLGDNGIFRKAAKAKEDTLTAQNEESMQIAETTNMIDTVVSSDRGDKGTQATVLWTGHTKTINTTYNFIDSSYDVNNYDYIIIDYSQNDICKSSVTISKNQIIKGKSNDIALWGYYQRYIGLHFVDNGFVIDVASTDNTSYYLYVNQITGIKL